jgi:hypothetical protein
MLILHENLIPEFWQQRFASSICIISAVESLRDLRDFFFWGLWNEFILSEMGYHLIW